MVKPTHDEIIRQATVDIAVLDEKTTTLREELNKLSEFPTRVAVLTTQVQSLRDEVNDLYFTRQELIPVGGRG